ncbi:MAG: rhomboid family intramembrane serine protease [Parachlamydiaceae bacterium]|nr:MAG: rhomboid family intramembrane serine protease [Parachlamydiaceae bacterium]
MMPIGDDNSLRKTIPFVTYLLIALNIIFFLIELAGGENFVKEWAFIPQRFSEDPSGNLVTLFTSMFMHAGWMHLGANMLYLWIFGDNVEDHLGKVKYTCLYFLSGIAATFAQYVFSPQSDLPNVGASGAIAGVLGAYILFSRSKSQCSVGQIHCGHAIYYRDWNMVSSTICKWFGLIIFYTRKWGSGLYGAYWGLSCRALCGAWISFNRKK